MVDVFAPLHLLFLIVAAVVPAAIGLLVLYWVVRLAVRHENRHSRR